MNEMKHKTQCNNISYYFVKMEFHISSLKILPISQYHEKIRDMMVFKQY